jgi:hypothetical protein
VQRPGHEAEVRELAVAVELLVERRDAAVQRLAFAEEVVEVLGDRDVDGVADRRRAGVEVDEDRAPPPRQREREVDGERRLADAAFARRDRDDPFDGCSLSRAQRGISLALARIAAAPSVLRRSVVADAKLTPRSARGELQGLQ